MKWSHWHINGDFVEIPYHPTTYRISFSYITLLSLIFFHNWPVSFCYNLRLIITLIYIITPFWKFRVVEFYSFQIKRTTTYSVQPISKMKCSIGPVCTSDFFGIVEVLMTNDSVSLSLLHVTERDPYLTQTGVHRVQWRRVKTTSFVQSTVQVEVPSFLHVRTTHDHSSS